LYLQLLEVLRSYSSSVNQQERTAMATRNRVTATVRTNIIDLDTAERIAAGTARSMGIELVDSK
jgi:ribosomal protein L11